MLDSAVVPLSAMVENRKIEQLLVERFSKNKRESGTRKIGPSRRSRFLHIMINLDRLFSFFMRIFPKRILLGAPALLSE